MRLLFDESVPAILRRSLTDHSVRTADEAGWSWIENGKLFALAAADFDAFATADENPPFQQNLAKLPIALLVIDSASNKSPAQLPSYTLFRAA